MLPLKSKILLIVSLTVFLAFGVSWYLLYSVVKSAIVRQNTEELSRQTALLSISLANGGVEKLNEDFVRWEGILRGRVTLVDSLGAVLADSAKDPALMENHLGRPEVRDALEKGEGASIRYSDTTKMYSLYFARRVLMDGNPWVLRAAQPLELLTSVYGNTRNRFILNLLGGIVLILAFGMWLTRRVFRPLDRIVDSAGKIADGGEIRFPLLAEPELQRLSESLDRMSARLRNALDELRSEREDLSLIVTALPVGVILLDEGRSVRYLNRVAEDLLAVRGVVPQGLPVERILPSGEMYGLIQSAPGEEELCGTFCLPGRGGRYLQICSRKTATGVLLVITDLTEARRIEQSRRDFIADAGHELQTPLTAVRAAAEYLLESDWEEEDRKLLATILAQQERMTRLVDDLLYLSRMESEPPRPATEEVRLEALLSSVVEENRRHPFAGKIRFSEDFPREALVLAPGQDLARGLNNIVENSVKYVHEKFGDRAGGEIAVSLRRSGDYWSVLVEDNGPGISEESASHLFERFRRGDNSRARGEWGRGGYGLGLAMAKRILLHAGGDIFFHPKEGGALFEILIPAKERQGK